MTTSNLLVNPDSISLHCITSAFDDVMTMIMTCHHQTQGTHLHGSMFVWCQIQTCSISKTMDNLLNCSLHNTSCGEHSTDIPVRLRGTMDLISSEAT